MYEGDTFFHLGFLGGTGLVILSIALMVLMIMATHRLAKFFPYQIWTVVTAIFLFWVFVWLSPQVYYIYYVMIFDDLPMQAVVGWPPAGGEEIVDLILFRGEGSISSHSRGALFWLITAVAFFSGVSDEEEPTDPNQDT
ncbi:MAG: hypothetical protein ACPGGK_04700 [Pikeienuella sp.]